MPKEHSQEFNQDRAREARQYFLGTPVVYGSRSFGNRQDAANALVNRQTDAKTRDFVVDEINYSANRDVENSLLRRKYRELAALYRTKSGGELYDRLTEKGLRNKNGSEKYPTNMFDSFLQRHSRRAVQPQTTGNIVSTPQNVVEQRESANGGIDWNGILDRAKTAWAVAKELPGAVLGGVANAATLTNTDMAGMANLARPAGTDVPVMVNGRVYEKNGSSHSATDAERRERSEQAQFTSMDNLISKF